MITLFTKEQPLTGRKAGGEEAAQDKRSGEPPARINHGQD